MGLGALEVSWRAQLGWHRAQLEQGTAGTGHRAHLEQLEQLALSLHPKPSSGLTSGFGSYWVGGFSSEFGVSPLDLGFSLWVWEPLDLGSFCIWGATGFGVFPLDLGFSF